MTVAFRHAAKHAVRLGGAALIALAAVTASAGIARADGGGELLVATPGEGWATALAKPLFTVNGLVPGDSDNADLLIKNNSSSRAALRIELVNASGGRTLLGDLRLGVATAAKSGRPVSLANTAHGGSAVLVTQRKVEPHGVVRMHMRLSLPEASGNSSMHAHAAFALKVVLGDARVVIPGRPPRDGGASTGGTSHHRTSDGVSLPDRALRGGSSGSLAGAPSDSRQGTMPVTGIEITGLLLLAAVLLGIGAAVALAAGNKRKDQP